MKKKILIGCGTFLFLVIAVVGGFLFLLFHRVEGQYFDSNGVRVHYTVEGQGEPVILVHGIGANADLNWRYPGITRLLARDFKVIAFDLRGHGLTDQPTDPNQYGIQLVEDIVRLMDHCGIQKAHVAGYSLGGFIVLKLVAAHPDRVCSADICAAGWKNPDDPSPIPNPYKRPPSAPAVVHKQASMTGGNWTSDQRSWMGNIFHRVRSWAGDQITNHAAIGALKKKVEELAVTRTALESNTVPTVCFVGTHDGLLPLAEDLHANMAHLDYHVLEGASHFTLPFYGQFKRTLRQFFLKHPCAPQESPPTNESAGTSKTP